MSDILARMEAAHAKRQKTAVEVPEYDTVWHFPPLTLADRAKIRKGVAADDDVELMVCTILHLAHDSDGNKVFQDDGLSRKALYGMEVSLMQRIMEQASPDGSEADSPKND